MRDLSEGRYWDLPYAADGTCGPDGVCFARLHALPCRVPPAGVHGTLVTIHGGYWKSKFGIGDEYGNAGTHSLAPFFLKRGFAVVELEYRSREHHGGGWPGTNEDILSALRRLAELQRSARAGSLRSSLPMAFMTLERSLTEALAGLRLDKLLLLGHSAGGTLALWAAHQLAGAAKTDQIQVALVMAVAPVADLLLGHKLRVSDEGDAVELYMKQAPDSNIALAEYRKASPADLLPVSFPLLIVYGEADKDVPPILMASYAEAALARSVSGLVSVVKISDADHFAVVNADSRAWTDHILPAIAARLDSSAAAALLSRHAQASSRKLPDLGGEESSGMPWLLPLSVAALLVMAALTRKRATSE
eukprot:TRINITY_DN60998_c0_g1_i1.p1 TRINITY_DN60998_c0_g1~~TRINITY_DN60998_c0_g1_i1.p1  ORF type:complete len:362 (-),score=76.53 TRINITY_DN60998_c0_g1_i1:9-1094(-)